MTLKHLICNLKAHKTYDEFLLYINNLTKIDFQKINFVLAPSNIYLSLLKNSHFNLCVQNINLYDNLNLTGDTNLTQLKSLNVKYAIIGHYERRKYYHENEYDIISKIKLALKNDIKVIYCVGESIEELKRRVEYQIIERSLAVVLNNIPKEQFKNIIIAYEPTYLIGNFENLDLNKIEKMINFIKNIVNNYYRANIEVVFGGNVNLDNLKDLTKIKNLDGFIISSAIQDSTNIPKIIDNMMNK